MVVTSNVEGCQAGKSDRPGCRGGSLAKMWNPRLRGFRDCRLLRQVVVASGLLAAPTCEAQSPPTCQAEKTEAQMPTDLALCASLETVVRKPGGSRLDLYEAKLEIYLKHYCHRNRAGGWRSEKFLRDTGPFTLVLQQNKWGGKDFGTHAPVIVWYSPEMLAWLKKNRPEDGSKAPARPEPIPDGALMIKEMYPAPAAACAGVEMAKLAPTSGAAVMVRDNGAAHDGWFWGWFGWTGWKPDWPASVAAIYPNMGFGQYCVNCHASARDNQTFSSLRNIENEPGEPLVFLSQDLIPPLRRQSHHEAIAEAVANVAETVKPGMGSTFLASLGLPEFPVPRLVEVETMPPASYDHVWARPKGHPMDGFLTSDQCLGCHDAGSTGLQFDMTAHRSDGLLVNISPYGTWRSSPMGMAGRDPIFFGQLASEVDSFHQSAKPLVEDTCLGCHGVLGQRALKSVAKQQGGQCRSMTRAALNDIPFPTGNDPVGALADYAGLARDGVSCVACHRMVFGAEAVRVHDDPQNACLDERRALLTPGLTGLAATFTGSFDMGPPDHLNGPFKKPLDMPMKHALGIAPVYNSSIRRSELCGSCHTVHLPILKDGTVIGHTYEQTTYAEWAFSAYRTGTTPDDTLPLGAGTQAESCQGCHMTHKDETGHPLASKIASIQEHGNFPQAENTLPRSDIDLPTREGFAKHILVGLNLIFVKMAQQFPAILGVPNLDPMLVSGAVPPLASTEHEMLAQAAKRTATVEVTDLKTKDDGLDATVKITNLTGHKFPSGVGFRRAFVEFTVRDASGETLWSSGQTNEAGVILDGNGRALDGEFWWQPDCSARITPTERHHQPHFEDIDRQDEVQIYEELTAAPGDSQPQICPSRAAQGPLTTSFLSRCARVKDNRLLPSGFLGLEDRTRIAVSLGAKRDLAEDTEPVAIGDDPDYREGGGDTLRYHVAVPELSRRAASVEATLYYQSTPPYYLQDRACTSRSKDTQRLMFLASNLRLANSAVANWKLKVATSGRVSVH